MIRRKKQINGPCGDDAEEVFDTILASSNRSTLIARIVKDKSSQSFDFLCVKSNSKAEHLFCVEAGKPIGRSIFEFVSSQKQDQLKQHCLQVSTSGATYVGDYLDDREEVETQLAMTIEKAGNHLVLIFDDEKEQAGYPEKESPEANLFSGMQGVTEGHSLQFALRRSESQLRNLTNHAPLALFEMELFEGGRIRVTYANSEFDQLHGATSEGAKEDMTAVLDVVHPDDRESVMNTIAEAIILKEIWSCEYRLIVEGMPVWISGRAQPLVDQNDEWRWYGYLIDITDTVNARNEREASERRFRDLFDRSPIGHMIVQRGSYVAANKKAAEIFEFDTPQDMLKIDDFLQHLTEETCQKLDKLIRDLLSVGEGAKREICEARTLNGRKVWVDVQLQLVDWNGSKAVHYTVIDITAATEYQEQLKRAELEARQAVRAKSKFLAMMSHEIRTPLNSIIGMTGLLLGEELSQVQKEYTSLAHESGQHLLSLINDILDFSKLEAGSVTLERRKINLQDEIHAATDVILPMAVEKGLELNLSIPEVADALFWGDGARLRQVILNLLANAVKFTERGSVDVNVKRLGSGSDKDNDIEEYMIEVVDTGIGIQATSIDALFNDFSQADDSMSRKFGGTGLGLSISKQITEMMGGEIGVESVEGQGSRFWIRLPLALCLDDLIQHNRKEEDKTSLPLKAEKSLRILVAEDNKANQVLIDVLLKQMGHTHTIVNNGLEAVEAVRHGSFDIILMDIQMPELNGVQALAMIRGLGITPRQLPIVALTAHALIGAEEQLLGEGFCDYLSKPIEVSQLESVIEKWSGGEQSDKRSA